MGLTIVRDADDQATTLPEGLPTDLDELCRMAAREMLAVALEAERRAYLEAHAHLRDQDGHRLVVGNGYARPREVVTGAGAVEVQAPRVHDRREGERFRSAILPPYMRRSPKVTEVLPVLYLRGLSTGDFLPALSEFFGTEAGLSASTVNRLTKAWAAEHRRWAERDLSGVDYVYWWADGVYFSIRLGEDRQCCLVIVGVRPDGRKELVALADGHRESTEVWAEVLRDLRARGLRAPELVVGDGALGLWAALREVFPGTPSQLCWVHKSARVLSALPKRLHGSAKAALHRIYEASGRTEALEAARAFADEFSDWPKATRKVTDHLERLLAFYDFPAEHWVHLRSVNPIESVFSTVRLRTDVTKGAGSWGAALAMAYKLVRAAEDRWRRVNAPHLVPLVRAGATFIDGKLVEREDQEGGEEPEETTEAAAA